MSDFPNQPIELIDTHAHFDLEDFDEDRSAVIERSFSGVFPPLVDDYLRKKSIPSPRGHLVAAIDPGVTLNQSRSAVQLAHRWSVEAGSQALYAGVAIHPNYTSQATEPDWDGICSLASDSKVVAIGETGLDLYWDDSPLEIQKKWFLRHIDLAKQTGLPLIIHCRDAMGELLPILRKERSPKLKGTIHSFSESGQEALELVNLGFSIGFTGSVTYTQKKFAPLWEAACIVPEDRLLIETDSPFLIPHPFRGKLQRNEPLMTFYVAHRLAELRGTTVEHIAEITTRNARSLFRLPE